VFLFHGLHPVRVLSGFCISGGFIILLIVEFRNEGLRKGMGFLPVNAG
jgi:hypothetical protein